jgi:hypothetical protein
MSSPTPALDPKHTALLVMDFQLGIVQRIPGWNRCWRACSTRWSRRQTVTTGSFLSDGTEDPDAETRDVLLGKVFPRRAQVIDIAAFRTLLQGT